MVVVKALLYKVFPFFKGHKPSRLFIGIDLPESQKQHLATLITNLPNTRWSPPENYHITLQFLGNVTDNERLAVDMALRALKAESFTLELSGVHTFAYKVSSILWVGVEKHPALIALQEKIERSTQSLIRFREEKDYNPHITLAKTSMDSIAEVESFAQMHRQDHFGSLSVKSFHLYKSVSDKQGVHYQILETYHLS